MCDPNAPSAGIDVSKHYLDVHLLPNAQHQSCQNNPQGIEQMVAFIRAIHPVRVAVESTGGYERGTFYAALAAGLGPTHRVVNVFERLDGFEFDDNQVFWPPLKISFLPRIGGFNSEAQHRVMR